MNYGNDPADQIVRFTLEGTEVALKLSGLAAKNFAMFVYAVLSDQKKTRGKTRMVRMLKEQRPFKFFRLPAEFMKEFAKEAKGYGLLYVPIRNKKKPESIEVVVFADDAAKIQRIYDNLGLDYVKAQAGEMMIGQEDEPVVPTAPTPSQSQTVQMENGAVSFEVGGFEDDFSIGGAAAQENSAENFTPGREKEPEQKKNPSGLSSPSKNSLPGSEGPERTSEQKPSVRKELQEIKQEQAEKKAEKAKQQEHQPPAAGRSRKKKRKRAKGR